MFMKLALGCFLLSTLCLAVPSSDDIEDCPFEDTVDLTYYDELPDGSYDYGGIIIPYEQTGIYEYEEIYNGVRVYKQDHVRGCLCKNRNCIKFCCHPGKEDLLMKTRDCFLLDENSTLSYNSEVPIRYANGTRARVNAMEHFIPTQGVPCASDAIMDAENNVLSKWEILENGSLYKAVDGIVVSRRDYCLLPEQSARSNELILVPLDCKKYTPLSLDELINDISKAISVPFIILTLMVYAFIPELQNLHGKCFMSYLVSLALYYTMFTIVEFADEQIDDSLGCTILGYLGYFFALGVFFWLNVISFDLFQSFRRSVPFRYSQNKRFLYYSAYAWGVPMCFTLILVALDHSNVNSYFKPGMDDGCWCDTYKWPAVGYFTGVNLAIVLVDILFLSLTFYKIVKTQRDIKKMLMKKDSKKSNNDQQDKNSFGLFLRLFLVMGITWIFEAIETIETLIDPLHRNPLYYVTDFLNAIIGVVIFICFVLNRKVLGLIKKTIKRRRGITDSSLREQESMLTATDNQISSISRRN